MSKDPTTLSVTTKRHYEELIGRIGSDYIDYRWMRHPVSLSHYRQTRRSVEFALGSVPAARDMLEIGSGPGTWTELCLAHASNLSIVDISSEMLHLVQERYPDVSIDLMCGDFLSDEIELPREFDTIFSARALEYMDDKGAMVEKSVRALRPGGTLIVITKNPRWRDKVLEQKAGKGEDPLHVDWIDAHDLEAHYRDQGLVDVGSFPVCLGSYLRPFNNVLGIWLCEGIQRRVHRRPLRPRIGWLTESYMTVGTKG